MSALKERAARQQLNRQSYNFTLILRGADPLEHLDALFEAGCDDAVFGEREGSSFAEFDRIAPSLAAAIGSAITQIESAVPALHVVRVEPDELVSAAAIAERTGRSRESVRLLAEHRRGPGDFPAPLCWVNAKTRLWRWAEVADWFARMEAVKLDTNAMEFGRFIGAVNSALELREYRRRSREDEARGVVDRILESVSLSEL